MRNLWRIAWQVGLLAVLARGGDWLTDRFGWPIPGNMVGLLILLALLTTGVVRLEWVEAGATWLLGNMLLFFVPVAVGILQYGDVLAEHGLSLLLVIAVSTLAVMAATGWTADRLARLRQRGREEQDVGRS